MAIEIFLHQHGKDTQLISLDSTKTVQDLIINFGDEKAIVLLEGADKPLDPKATLEEAGVGERTHLHISSCETVAIKVRFNGEVNETTATPSTTARTILAWATGEKGFDLPVNERPKYILRLSEDKKDVPQDEHIGSVAENDCSVLLDLVPDENFQG